MSHYRWRHDAKQLLYDYSTKRQLIKEYERDILYGQGRVHDRQYRGGALSDPTAMKAVRLAGPRLEQLRQEVRAVELLLRRLDTERRLDQKRAKLIELVYFTGQASLFQAAIQLDVSERTIKRWNDQCLRELVRYLGWLEA